MFESGTNRPRIDRRTVMQSGLLLGVGLAMPAVLRITKARAAKQIFVTGYGGAYAEAMDAVYFKPFAEETGITVIQTEPADLARLKAQVSSKTVEWDVVEPFSSQVGAVINEGLLQKIDYSIVKVDRGDLLYDRVASEYTISAWLDASVIAYNTKNTSKHPSTWAEFWDVQNFPGRRGLWTKPGIMFEAALLADGVSPKNIYPLDIDRVFASLDKIKPHVQQWIDANPQTVQTLITGELDFTYSTGNRANAAAKAGDPVGYSRDQLLVFLNAFAVPVGAPNPEDGMRLLNYMFNADRQADLFNRLGQSPTLKSGFAKIPEKGRADAIDVNGPNNLLIDVDYWGRPGRLAELSSRYKEWLLT